MFVTSETYQGHQFMGLWGADQRCGSLAAQAGLANFAGVAGADLECQTLAKAFDPDHAHRYRAWISDDVSEPATTFEHGALFATTPYVLRSGVEVAASFDDLIQHGPAVGITLTDTLETVFKGPIWTHTTHAGAAVPDDHHCDQWTSKAFERTAVFGLSGYPPGSPELQAWTDERQWTRSGEANCSLTARLYCFEN